MTADRDETGGRDGTGGPEVADPWIAHLSAEILHVAGAEGRLPAERALADRLGVRRHQLRRALQALRDRGALPRPAPRAAARAAPDAARADALAGDTNPVEVIEMRLMIEPALARLAALRATPNQIAEMRAAFGGTGRGPQAARPADLHRMIAAAAGNGLARRLHDLLRAIDREVRVSSQVAHMHPEHDAEEHHAIVAAIARRDADAAETAMRLHLQSIHRILSAVLA
ncbi:FadR/GntR family transcriptional regulator [Frigidibacter sp. MR17.24]|uniref:FadR/GntR family transcriptional regulator n=1 Tax=Frigidibacter sp. MR17.24 TaxID=3127345 RepID=UPI0030130DA4